MKVTDKSKQKQGVHISEIAEGACFAVVGANREHFYLKTTCGSVQLDTGTYRLDCDTRNDPVFYTVDAEVVVHG